MNADKIGALLILLLVAYVVLDALAFSPEAAAEPLHFREKGLLFTALGIGLVTFFSALVTIEPAVAGRSVWSAWDFISAIRSGALPPAKSAGPVTVLVYIALAYLLIVAAAIAFCFSRSRKLLKMIGLLGCLFSIGALGWGDQGFQSMFFGFTTPGSVSYGPAVYGLSLVMAALLLLSV